MKRPRSGQIFVKEKEENKYTGYRRYRRKTLRNWIRKMLIRFLLNDNWNYKQRLGKYYQVIK